MLAWEQLVSPFYLQKIIIIKGILGAECLHSQHSTTTNTQLLWPVESTMKMNY